MEWALLRRGAVLEAAEASAAGLQLWQRGVVASVVPRTTGAAASPPELMYISWIAQDPVIFGMAMFHQM